jgi:DnaK suppressor protein
MMDKADRALIKDRLNTKINRAKSKIERMEDMTQPIAPENAIGRISRMDAINNKSVMEAALRNARKDLAAMENALNHIQEDPEFGICKKCRKSIPMQRLLLLPGSSFCVHCA